jgi:hypothetical protein
MPDAGANGIQTAMRPLNPQGDRYSAPRLLDTARPAAPAAQYPQSHVLSLSNPRQSLRLRVATPKVAPNEAARALCRRFASAGLDWSEPRPHFGAALSVAPLKVALKRKWVLRDLDSKDSIVTSLGRCEILTRFGLRV